MSSGSLFSIAKAVGQKHGSWIDDCRFMLSGLYAAFHLLFLFYGKQEPWKCHCLSSSNQMV